MEIRPITFRQACDFVAEHHRHHRPTVGCKFCVGLYDTDKLVGVAICGRPVGRKLDDGFTCEVNRLCPLFVMTNALCSCEAPYMCVKEKCSRWLEDKQKCAIAVMGGKK